MGHVTGFLDYTRRTGASRPPEERIKNYREFLTPLPQAELQKQGARCMDCGVPWCHAMGCPVLNLIPEWNELVYRDDWREALIRLEMTNNLPEITGRVCPAPCETACTLAINSSPVAIKQIELAIAERGFAEGWVVPRLPQKLTGRRVAIVGSGPAGLAAAQQLARAGHEVTVFEKSPAVGGLLRFGIPDFKLEKSVVERRVAQMRAEGVRFECGVNIGEDISARYLRQSFDGILLALGAGEPRDLTVPGRDLEGIHFAMDYLTRSNRFVAGEIGEDDLISARNKRVLVIGGGDTGSDCVGTANRQGAREVSQVEILSRPPEWKESWNPSWPLWPNILRTTSSHEEGCLRDWSVVTKGFSGAEGKVREVQLARVQWSVPTGQAAGTGAPALGAPQMSEIEGSQFSLKADLVLLAMGFLHVAHSRLLEELGVQYDRRGNIAATDYATTASGVFVAGDAATGASLVVRAIYHAREAARCMDRFLRG